MCLLASFHGNKDLFSLLNYLNNVNIQTNYCLSQMLVYSSKHIFVQQKVEKFQLLMVKSMALIFQKLRKLYFRKFLRN